MKKKILYIVMVVIGSFTTVNAQTKPKSMREVRDSVFTSLNLSDENKKKMHDLIQEIGKAKGEVSKDATLTNDQKKEKLLGLTTQQSKREQEIMTPEQRAAWGKFAKEYRRPKN